MFYLDSLIWTGGEYVWETVRLYFVPLYYKIFWEKEKICLSLPNFEHSTNFKLFINDH